MADTKSGPGRVLIAVYAIFALAATARSGVQLATKFHEAPLAYLLSAFAGVVYIVATVGLIRGATMIVAISCTVELIGVLTVGTLSLLDRSGFPDATVWSAYGRGYGFVPLVLPVLGLLWIRRTGPYRSRVPRVSVSTTVPASPDDTWATAADLSRFGEWLVLHEGWRGEVPSEITSGTELTSVVTVKGLRNRIAWLVDAYDPPHSLTISGKGVGGTRVSLVLSVKPAGQESTVTVDAEITGPTTIGPVGMLIGRALKTDMRRSVTRLTDLLS